MSCPWRAAASCVGVVVRCSGRGGDVTERSLVRRACTVSGPLLLLRVRKGSLSKHGCVVGSCECHCLPAYARSLCRCLRRSGCSSATTKPSRRCGGSLTSPLQPAPPWCVPLLACVPVVSSCVKLRCFLGWLVRVVCFVGPCENPAGRRRSSVGVLALLVVAHQSHTTHPAVVRLGTSLSAVRCRVMA
jgi:hypothetical protein